MFTYISNVSLYLIKVYNKSHWPANFHQFFQFICKKYLFVKYMLQHTTYYDTEKTVIPEPVELERGL